MSMENTLALVIIGIIWFVLFFLFPLLRREQIVSSLFASALFPILSIIASSRAAGIPTLTELIFLFFIGGVASIIYHIIFGQYYLQTPKQLMGHKKEEQHIAWKWIGAFFGITWLMITLSLMIPNASGGVIILLTGSGVALYILAAKRDLFFDALMSAALMIVLFAAVEIVITGQAIIGIQSEIYLKTAGIGLILGPLYELVRNTSLTYGKR